MVKREERIEKDRKEPELVRDSDDENESKRGEMKRRKSKCCYTYAK